MGSFWNHAQRLLRNRCDTAAHQRAPGISPPFRATRQADELRTAQGEGEDLAPGTEDLALPPGMGHPPSGAPFGLRLIRAQKFLLRPETCPGWWLPSIQCRMC